MKKILAILVIFVYACSTVAQPNQEVTSSIQKKEESFLKDYDAIVKYCWENPWDYACPDKLKGPI